MSTSFSESWANNCSGRRAIYRFVPHCLEYKQSEVSMWMVNHKGGKDILNFLQIKVNLFQHRSFQHTRHLSLSLNFLKNKVRFKSNAHSLHYLIRPHSQPTCIELLNTINCNSLPEWRGQSGGEATEYEYLSACLFAKMKSTGRLTLTLPSPLFDLTHPKLTNEMLLKGFH